MGVARTLGFDDPASPALVAVRIAWCRWCALDPDLAVVDALDDLPGWTARASRSDKNAVLAKLAALTEVDLEAATALTWLLLPGAVAMAAKLADLHPDIDEMVAGQLWLEASRAYELVGCQGVARAILRRIRSAVMADLAVGDAAERRDRAWAHAVADEDALALLTAPEPEPFADYTLLELLTEAWVDRAVVGFDLRLVWDLAQLADRLDAPAHRGRMGLTSPAVVEAFAAARHLNARTVRRRAGEVLDRLREYAAVREDDEALARWRRRHPRVVLSAREEMELAIQEEQTWWLITGPEQLAPEAALARVKRGVIPRQARRA